MIELLVVVAIIGLLISILLPSLREAREQARIAKCLSNERQLGLAANGYLIDFSTLPFAVPFNYNGQSFSYITEFIWGGAMPDKTAADWNSGPGPTMGIPGATATNIDVYRLRPRERPMNRYMATEVVWDRPVAQRVSTPAIYPEFFKCPSDGARRKKTTQMFFGCKSRIHG